MFPRTSFTPGDSIVVSNTLEKVQNLIRPFVLKTAIEQMSSRRQSRHTPKKLKTDPCADGQEINNLRSGCWRYLCQLFQRKKVSAFFVGAY